MYSLNTVCFSAAQARSGSPGMMALYRGAGGGAVSLEEEVEDEEEELGIAETYNDYMPSKCRTIQLVHCR